MRDDDSQDGAGNGGGPLAAIRAARRQFAELTGKDPESVTGVHPTDDGWQVVFEVVELERVPATTSVLATYEAEVDRKGNLLTYGRLRRYNRNQTDAE